MNGENKYDQMHSQFRLQEVDEHLLTGLGKKKQIASLSPENNSAKSLLEFND